MKARITRVRASGGGTAWMIEGVDAAIADAIGDETVDALEVEIAIGQAPAELERAAMPDAAIAMREEGTPLPQEVEHIARTGLTTT